MCGIHHKLIDDQWKKYRPGSEQGSSLRPCGCRIGLF
jgi:hypothetical protein